MNKFHKAIIALILIVITLSSVATFAFAEKSCKVSGDDIAIFAKSLNGSRYSYGASGPNAFDCGGFVRYVYSHFGATPPEDIVYYSQADRIGSVVAESDAKAGDIIAWSGHVGIYLGGDKAIHALNSRLGVKITSVAQFRNSHGVTNPKHIYIRVNVDEYAAKLAAKKKKAEAAAAAKIEKDTEIKALAAADVNILSRTGTLDTDDAGVKLLDSDAALKEKLLFIRHDDDSVTVLSYA